MAEEEKQEGSLPEIQFVLKHPFEYAYGGNTRMASFLVLTPPSSKNRKECAALKQSFMRALKSQPDVDASKAKESKDEEITGEDISIVIAMSDVDLVEFYEIGRRLLSSGVVKVEGETKLTTALLDLMELEEVERLLGEYLMGFTLRSSLGRLNVS